MHTNNAMLRHFWWASNALWPHDLAQKEIEAFVLLSGDDDIVPSSDIASLFDLYHDQRRVQSEGHIWEGFLPSLLTNDWQKDARAAGGNTLIKTHVIDGAAHGEFVFDDDQKKKVVRAISTMMRLNRIKNGGRAKADAAA